MKPELLAFLYIGALAAQTIWSLVLNVLSLRHLRLYPELPKSLSHTWTDGEYKKSQEYTKVKIGWDNLTTVYKAILSLILLFSGILPWIYTSLQGHISSPVLLGCVFFIVVMFLSGAFEFPLSIYETFGIESRFGFNKSTPKLFIIDTLKSIALGAVLGMPLLAGVLAFMNAAGNMWWLWAFALILTFQIFLLLVYPVWLAPLFNKFTPLKDGELRTALLSLAQKIAFPTQGIYVMDGSRRSGHSNAYFTGLGKMRRIVLFDTLIEQMSVAEMESILCHEMGHYKKGHVVRMLIMQTLMLGAGLYILSLISRSEVFYQAFGFSGNVASLQAVGLLLFTIGFAPITFWLSPLISALSRKHEYEADAFAVQNSPSPSALHTSLIKLAAKNLSNLTPHPWYSAFHYSHPTLMERLAALEKCQKG